MQKLCHLIIFKLLGWKAIGDVPTEKKFLLVGLPHTSNWDFVIAWLAVTALGLRMQIFTKDMYHFWPLSRITKALGILPVNRRKSTNFVESVASMYQSADTLRATIAPEGTRKRVKELKSGYYYIAKTAGIPIVVAGPNYKEKSFTFMPARRVMGTFEEDQKELIDFCETQYGKYPNNSFY